MEPPLGYHPCIIGFLTGRRDPAGGQCLAGSLTGAVASERVSEAPKGSLRMVGNHSKSAKAEGSLTATPTGGAGTKVGLSDPVVLSGNAIAQRIKATLGITGLSLPRVQPSFFSTKLLQQEPVCIIRMNTVLKETSR